MEPTTRSVMSSFFKPMIAAALVSAAMSLAYAHHGWSEYDATRLVKLTGKVTASGYEHPHGYVRMEAEGKTWLAVLAPPARMESRGLPRAAITPGSTVTLEGYLHRSKADEMRAERIITDGKAIELR